MHEFHEQAAAETGIIDSLESDLTLSMPSATSDEKPKPPQAMVAGRGQETLSPECESEVDCPLLGEALTSMTSADEDGIEVGGKSFSDSSPRTNDQILVAGTIHKTNEDCVVMSANGGSPCSHSVYDDQEAEDMKCGELGMNPQRANQLADVQPSLSVCSGSVQLNPYKNDTQAIELSQSNASRSLSLDATRSVEDADPITEEFLRVSPEKGSIKIQYGDRYGCENHNEAESLDRDVLPLQAARTPQPIHSGASGHNPRVCTSSASNWANDEHKQGLLRAEDKPRTPAVHRRDMSGEGQEIQFKYEDLKTLSLQDNRLEGPIPRKAACDSDKSMDDDIDDDVFSGIDDIPIRITVESQHDDEVRTFSIIPPPPPPPLGVNDQYGRILDERSALKSVNSDITSSVLAGERFASQYYRDNPDQLGTLVDEMNVLKTVNSDITGSILAGERIASHYIHVSDEDEEGITLIEDFGKLAVQCEDEEENACKNGVATANLSPPEQTHVHTEDISQQRDSETTTSPPQKKQESKKAEKEPTKPATSPVIDGTILMKLGASLMETFSGGMWNTTGKFIKISRPLYFEYRCRT
jgi:hypothetical protein